MSAAQIWLSLTPRQAKILSECLCVAQRRLLEFADTDAGVRPIADTFRAWASDAADLRDRIEGLIAARKEPNSALEGLPPP